MGDSLMMRHTSAKPAGAAPTFEASGDQLAQAIDRARRARPEPKSNYFFGRLRATAFPLWTCDHSLLFLDREHDFYRVHFVSADLDRAAAIAAAIPQRPLVVDYVTRTDDHAPVDAAFAAAGFAKVATYRRMTNNCLPVRRAASPIAHARTNEADALFAQLCLHFDVRRDRLPSADEFAAWVRDERVLVHRDGADIDGYTAYQLRGRRAHWHYLYTRPGSNRAVAFKLVADFFAEMATHGVTTSTLWVEERNTAVLALHKRLGFVYDGLVTHVSVKE